MEECNGLDDDLDGEVDEGYPDADQDGVADCVDEACTVAVAEPHGVAVDEACLRPDPSYYDYWHVGVDWQWTGLASSPARKHVDTLPLIAEVTGDDVPDVIVLAAERGGGQNPASIVVLDGATGAEHLDAPGFAPGYFPLVADVDADGEPEIVASASGGAGLVEVRALDTNLEEIWSTDLPAPVFWATAVADLEGDGTPEVLIDDFILDGASGEVLHALEVDHDDISTRGPTVGDFDLDGEREILLGDRCFAPGGSVEWTVDRTGWRGHWWVPAQLDDDLEAELALVADGYLEIYSHEGQLEGTFAAEGSSPGPPCAADLDGDGQTELAWASGWSSPPVLAAFEFDGTLLWSLEVADDSGLAGCSVFDFDGDGAYEVTYADEETFRIVDGRTGQTLFFSDEHESLTGLEYPTIGDLDGDGSVEVLVAHNGYGAWSDGGVTAFHHVDGYWMGGGGHWPVHDWTGSGVSPDGSVQAFPTETWAADGLYRGAAAIAPGAPDLVVEITDACVAGCETGSPALLAVQVSNVGTADAPGPIDVAVEGADGEGLGQASLPEMLEAGEAAAGIVFELSAWDLAAGDLRVLVDGGGTILECHEQNNDAVLEWEFCW